MYLVFKPCFPELQAVLRYIFRNVYQSHGCAGIVSDCSPAMWEAGDRGTRLTAWQGTAGVISAPATGL